MSEEKAPSQSAQEKDPAKEAPKEQSTTVKEGSPENGAELEAKLKEAEKKYVYLYSEFENYKKRVAKEKSEVLKFGWEPLAHELLSVIDHLEMALKHADPKTDAALKEGVQMILKQFHNALEKRGIIPIVTDESEFDPNVHEAVAHEESDHPKGKIVREQARGYTMHGRLLRPARVIVSQGEENASSEKESKEEKVDEKGSDPQSA